MTSRAFVALARKELRELAPVWAAAMAAVIATFLGPIPQLRGIGVLAWVVALPALGAMSFGHDLRHRMLETLLVQPVPRAALLVTKLAVLVPLLASLTGLLWVLEPDPAARFAGWWFLLPAACALCLAPWLTLVGRSELAGVAAAGGVPALLWILANGVAAIAYGDANPVGAAALQEAIFTPAVVAALGVGAVGSVGAFLRIQAVGAFEGGAQARSGTRGMRLPTDGARVALARP